MTNQTHDPVARNAVLEEAAKVLDERADEWRRAIENGLKKVAVSHQEAAHGLTELEVAAYNIRALRTQAEQSSAQVEPGEALVERVVEAMRDDPFQDDIRLRGTTAHDERMEHYARIALQQSTEREARLVALLWEAVGLFRSYELQHRAKAEKWRHLMTGPDSLRKTQADIDDTITKAERNAEIASRIKQALGGSDEA